MTSSVPLSLDIPRIRVRARIIPLGLRPDGSPAVPPLTAPFVTSWYDGGPTPGARGAAVIFGHVDSAAAGPAVFYSLGRLRVGNVIDVTLADRRTAVFSVYAAGLYPKTGFPTLAVYGYTRWPTLRLVTCGGQFDRRSRAVPRQRRGVRGVRGAARLRRAVTPVAPARARASARAQSARAGQARPSPRRPVALRSLGANRLLQPRS